MLAIAGGKGGCGKTTTTLGLAAALARQRRTVLAADADRDMPNLHALAGVDRSPGLAELDDRPPSRVAHEAAAHPGVSVLPASTCAARFDLVGALERLRRWDGPVLVDCPAGAGRAAVDPLRVADRTLLVSTLEPQCLRDAAKTAALAAELGADVVGAVVTKVDAGPATGDDRAAALAGAERLLDCPVLETVPRAAEPESVLSDPAVRASYARLAPAARRR